MTTRALATWTLLLTGFVIAIGIVGPTACNGSLPSTTRVNPDMIRLDCHSPREVVAIECGASVCVVCEVPVPGRIGKIAQ